MSYVSHNKLKIIKFCADNFNEIKYVFFLCVEDCKTWSIKRQRRLYGRKPFDYAAFDQSGDFLIVAAESDVEFIYDSVEPVVSVEDENTNASKVPGL